MNPDLSSNCQRLIATPGRKFLLAAGGIYVGGVTIGVLFSGAAAFYEASLAAAICGMGSGIAWFLLRRPMTPASAWGAIVLALAARTGLPLLLLMLVHLHGGLWTGSLIYYFVGFYLILLLAETILVLPGTMRSAGSGCPPMGDA